MHAHFGTSIRKHIETSDVPINPVHWGSYVCFPLNYSAHVYSQSMLGIIKAITILSKCFFLTCCLAQYRARKHPAAVTVMRAGGAYT